MKQAIYFLLGLWLAGCGQELDTPFHGDPTVSNLRTATAYCRPDADGQYADVTTIESQGQLDGHDYAVGGGCIRRSIAETWAALQAPAAITWRDATLKGYAPFTDPRVPLAFRAQYEAGPMFFTQSWTIEWFHQIVRGTTAAPERIAVQYQKVKGTGYISFWRGTVELERVTDTVTSFSMFNQISAAQTDAARAAETIRDFHGRLR